MDRFIVGKLLGLNVVRDSSESKAFTFSNNIEERHLWLYTVSHQYNRRSFILVIAIS